MGANRDQILDFVSTQGDKIDLSTIDASTHDAATTPFISSAPLPAPTTRASS
jgi:hypothetical protein